MGKEPLWLKVLQDGWKGRCECCTLSILLVCWFPWKWNLNRLMRGSNSNSRGHNPPFSSVSILLSLKLETVKEKHIPIQTPKWYANCSLRRRAKDSLYPTKKELLSEETERGHPMDERSSLCSLLCCDELNHYHRWVKKKYFFVCETTAGERIWMCDNNCDFMLLRGSSFNEL